ncbi:MAG: hypothetical protein ACI93N_002530 [Flavobacteriaceae bacterium]|jgi:hypothetical protein
MSKKENVYMNLSSQNSIQCRKNKHNSLNFQPCEVFSLHTNGTVK